VGRAQPLGAGEVGDGSRHPQHSVEAGGGEPQPLESGVEELARWAVEPAVRLDLGRPDRRVETAAVGLDLTGGGDPRRDTGRALGRAGLELAEGERRHSDDQVEAVEHGRHPRPVAADSAGCAAALMPAVAKVPARTGAHRGHDLRGHAAVERVGERSQRRRPEQRQIVENQRPASGSAGGSVVMETMMAGTDYEMINMYHLDGDDLVLTHYCAGGNQPTMRLDRAKATATELPFVFTGGPTSTPPPTSTSTTRSSPCATTAPWSRTGPPTRGARRARIW
jgi:hypothetical protein